jgi:hypothetical protein
MKSSLNGKPRPPSIHPFRRACESAANWQFFNTIATISRMDFITAILLIVLGILAAAQLIVARAAELQAGDRKPPPAQGVLGLIVCLGGCGPSFGS